MSKYSKQIEMLLDKYPRCRNSDNDLIIGMLHVNGVVLSEREREIVRSLNFESITRTRRKLQEEGKYLPTNPEIAANRRFKGYRVEQMAPLLEPDQLMNLITEDV